MDRKQGEVFCSLLLRLANFLQGLMKVPNFLGYFNLLKQFSKNCYLLVKKSGIMNLILIAALLTRLPILNYAFLLLNTQQK